MSTRWIRAGRATAGLFIFALALVAGASQACIHVPTEYREAVTERTKQALLFHDGTNAHLVIGTQVAAAKKLPEHFSWVLPLPSLPSRYAEADAFLFEELYRATEPPRPSFGGLRGKNAPKAGAFSGGVGIEVHTPVTVGRYEIRPVQVLRERAGDELNRWLTGSGYAPVPASMQQYYLRPGAVFLAVKVRNPGGENAKLKPLHIVYRSEQVAMPLKFAEKSGIFDVLLYTFTPQPLRPTHFAAHRVMGLPSVSIRPGGSTPLLARITGNRQGYLTRFTGYRFNTPGRLVRTLRTDPSLPAPPTRLSGGATHSAKHWRTASIRVTKPLVIR